MALEPITRQEKIIAGENLKPITRMERFLKEFGGGGSGGVSPEEVTTICNNIIDTKLGVIENGTY